MSWAGSYRHWFSAAASHVEAVKTNPDFQPADEALARHKRHVAGPFPDGPKPRLFKLRAKSDLAHLGTGMQLYFILTKHLIVLLLIVGIIQLPQAIISAKGDMLRLKGIYRTALGNLGNDPDEEDRNGHVMAAFYNNRTVTLSEKVEVNIGTMIIVFGCLDLLCTMLTNGFMFWFVGWKTPKVVARNDELVHAMSDHAIIVRRLPPQIGPHQVEYEKKLREHFHNLLVAGDVTERPEFLIPEVVVVREDCTQFAKLVKLGKLKHDMRLMETRRLNGKKVSKRRFSLKEEKVKKLTDELSDGRFNPSPTRDACAAFVVFQHAADRNQIVEEYEDSVSTWTEATQPTELKFYGHSLKVEPAPEPEDVILEHLHFKNEQRVVNFLIIWCVIFLHLLVVFLICGALNALSQEPEGKAEKEAKIWSFEIETSSIDSNFNLTICDLLFDNTRRCENQGISDTAIVSPVSYDGVETMRKLNDTCYQILSRDYRSVGVQLRFDTPIEMRCASVSVTDNDEIDVPSFVATVHACEASSDKGFQVCTEARRTRKRTGGPMSMTFHEWVAESTTDCDDVTLRDTSWNDLGSDALNTLEQFTNAEWYSRCLCTQAEHWRKCTRWHVKVMLRKFAYWAMLVVIQVVSGIMRKVIRKLVWKLEKPACRTDYIALVLSKVFVATFLNWGFSLLLTSAKLFRFHTPIYSGEYGEFNGEWYESVGRKFIDYGLIHIAFPRIFDPLFVAAKYVWRKCVRKRMKIQAELDTLYKRGSLSIDARLANLVAYTCFCLMYSGPFPLMPFTGVLGFLITYWADKMEVIYEDGNPPFFSEAISNVAVGLLEVGVIAKLISSIHAYGHPLVGNACQVNGGENSFLERLIEAAEEERTPLRYAFNPENAAVMSDWFGDRLKGMVLSCAAFPSTLYLACTGAFIAVSICVFTSLFWLPKRWTRRPGARLMSHIHYKVDTFTEQASLADVMADLEKRGRTTSYRPAANPAYAHVIYAKEHLLRRMGTHDFVSHFFEEPDIERSPWRAYQASPISELVATQRGTENTTSAWSTARSTFQP